MKSAPLWLGRPRAAGDTEVNEHDGTANGPRPTFTKTSEGYVHGLYATAVSAEDASTYLRDCTQYDSIEKRWSIPPAQATKGFIGAVFGILQSIVGRFVGCKEPEVEREILNTSEVLACDSTNEDGYRLCPTLLVRASGPSFQVPSALSCLAPSFSNIGFSNIATCFSVKPETAIGSEKGLLDEMESYAGRTFREQLNRMFVRFLIITEEHVRLVHFDRAGSQISPPINIHQHPTTFIRIVAGLSSTNERCLGIDDSLRWTVIDGKRCHGTLTTTGPSGEPKTYRILGQIPTARNAIRGRATTCWRVQDPETLEEYVIKDSWRPEERTAEHEFLELVKNIPGVVQMVSYETGRGETMDFRCPSTHGLYHNRVSARVTMESYGKPLMFFSSVLQLLYAVRDALAAHRRVVRQGVRTLHRDISHNNILLGKEGAPEGERGVIIDFDMAFRATDEQPTANVEHNIGTRLFQSLCVVGSSYLEDEPSAYDYLDDLESFFYLVAYAFLLYKPDGSCLPSTEQGPSIVEGWAEEDPERAYSNKRKVYGAGTVANRALRLVEKNWGSVCGTLFNTFSWWTLDRRGEKSDLLVGPEATGGPNPLEELHSLREEHYAEVLKMFDEAIEALSKSTRDEVTAPPQVNPSSDPPTSVMAAFPVCPPGPTAPPSPPFPFSAPAAAPVTSDLRCRNGATSGTKRPCCASHTRRSRIGGPTPLVCSTSESPPFPGWTAACSSTPRA